MITLNRRISLCQLLSLVLLAIAATLPGFALGQTNPPELRILNWAEYIDPEIVTEFEQTFEAKVTIHFFESEDDRDQLLAERDGHGYDIFMLNDLHLDRHVRRGWINPLEAERIPNLEHIDPRWLRPDSNGRIYGVPYFWGTAGIAYREDLVTAPPRSWRELLKPADSLNGKIAMIRSNRSLLAVALKALDQSLNSADRALLEQAGELLLAQKPYVGTYTYVTISKDSPLVTGDIWVAYAFNGDALALTEYQPNIVYLTPPEGSELWIDYLAIARHAEQPELATAFINFLNEPKIAARNAQYVHYATANQAAEKILPPEFLNNPIIYPNEAILSRSELMRDLPPRTEKRVNEIALRVLAD